MTLRRIIKMTFATALLAATATACVESDDDGGRLREVWVKVNINIHSGNGPLTRAEGDYPWGGEDGDGREAGINYENTVNNVTLLFFQNLEAGSPCLDAMTFTAGTDYTQAGTTINVKRKMISPETITYHVLAVANLNQTETFIGKTFKQVSDLIITTPWQTAATVNDYTDFTMSSRNDATVTIDLSTGKGTEADPFTVDDITVERLASRIDIDSWNYNQATPAPGNFTYTSGSRTYKIIDIQLFNTLKPATGTYLLKHYTTDDANWGAAAFTTFFDSEGTAPVQSKYVLDPISTDKAADGDVSAANYDNQLPADLSAYAAWADLGLSDASADKTVVPASAADPERNHKFFILGYARENVLPRNFTTKTAAEQATLLQKYATALAVKYTITEGGTTTTHYDHYYLKHNNYGTATDAPADTDPMRYSLVRNNIYRVSFTVPEGGSLKIVVKKWDPHTHTYIYI